MRLRWGWQWDDNKRQYKSDKQIHACETKTQEHKALKHSTRYTLQKANLAQCGKNIKHVPKSICSTTLHCNMKHVSKMTCIFKLVNINYFILINRTLQIQIPCHGWFAQASFSKELCTKPISDPIKCFLPHGRTAWDLSQIQRLWCQSVSLHFIATWNMCRKWLAYSSWLI